MVNKKKTDKNNIFYYSQDLQEILNLQLDLTMQEIGFVMTFKAAYIYHKGTIPINKLCQFCRVFDNPQIFVNFIEKNYEKKGDFFYSKEYEIIIKGGQRSRNRHWNWKGGITSKNHAIRQSSQMKQWRNDVFERDEYTCEFCGQKGGILHAHHIYSFAKYPKLRLDIDNGMTLCKECHNKEHSKKGGDSGK